MPPEHRVHVVEDPEDTRELAAFVAGLSDRLEGRAVVHPTPLLATSSQLAAELLVALGKSFEALTAERCKARAWDLVDTWIAAERVRALFVLRAHLLAPALCQELVDLAKRAGLDLWLVGQGGCAGLMPAGADTPHRLWDPASFVERWADIERSEHLPDGHSGFPEVPGDEFVTFRASCRDLLDPASFERVDRVFCEAMATTLTWLRGWQGRQLQTLTEEVPIGDTATHLQGLLVSSSSSSEAVTRLRGAQAAFFRFGWLVAYSPQAFAGTDTGTLLLRPSLDPGTATALRRLCTPQSTAVMALFLAVDLSTQAMSRLSLASIADDGGAVSIDSGRYSIPYYAQSLVRAQVIHRQREGAEAAHPLFAHPTATGPRLARLLLDALRSVARKTSVSVGRADVHTSGGGGEAWLEARHVSVSRLDGLRPGWSL
jgi:hypothetical protein